MAPRRSGAHSADTLGAAATTVGRLSAGLFFDAAIPQRAHRQEKTFGGHHKFAQEIAHGDSRAQWDRESRDPRPISRRVDAPYNPVETGPLPRRLFRRLPLCTAG